jgi:hypothetical protein
MRPVCVWCGKELPLSRWRFCSDKCAGQFRYYSNRERFIAKSKEWALKNPERYRQINNLAVNKFLLEKRERFNKLCNLNYHKKKVKQLEQELSKEKEAFKDA